jgi:hypothetical protein
MREGLLSPENSKKNVSCGCGAASGKAVSSECVAGWQERLWESLVAFQAVQMEHCNAFASGRCDHLMARRAEREKALARLQMELEAAQNKLLMGEDGSFANRVRAKLSTLIDMETALAEGARRVRKHLMDELGTIRQRRRAFQGYGQYRGASSQPRFLNSKT